MARSFSHRGRPRGGSHRVTQWHGSTPRTALQTLAAATTKIDQFFVPGEDPLTVIRVRGRLLVQTDQIAASESPFGAYGMGIVSAEAIAAGVASVPPPYTNNTWDGWLVHGYFAAPTIFGSAIGMHNLSQTFEFDSKAMRKMDPGDRLAMVLQNGHSTDGCAYLWDFRLLVKEY